MLRSQKRRRIAEEHIPRKKLHASNQNISILKRKGIINNKQVQPLRHQERLIDSAVGSPMLVVDDVSNRPTTSIPASRNPADGDLSSTLRQNTNSSSNILTIHEAHKETGINLGALASDKDRLDARQGFARSLFDRQLRAQAHNEDPERSLSNIQSRSLTEEESQSSLGIHPGTRICHENPDRSLYSTQSRGIDEDVAPPWYMRNTALLTDEEAYRSLFDPVLRGEEDIAGLGLN